MKRDCWTSLKGRKQNYLPPEEHEPNSSYKNRLDRTRFDNRFEPAIRGHAGLLSDFEVDEDNCPPSLIDSQENIDLQGNDLVTFFQTLDELVLRDGGVGILVDYPTEDPSIQTNADMLAAGRRPYLVAIDRRNILNWEITTIAGQQTITKVTIKEQRKERTGLFGSKLQTYYRVLVPGGYSVYQIVQGEGGWKAVLREEGQTDLEVVPLVWYSLNTTADLFQATPPFLNLAGLNIEHLQKRSSLNEVLHKCNMPVPVRKGVIRTLQDLLKPIVKLVIGPNSLVDVPNDGDFYFAEPTGNAIAATQGDIEKLEGAMDRESLAFLNGGEAEKTATEVVVDSAQTQCSLKGMARRKENSFKKLRGLWCRYTGEEEPPEGSGIKVHENVLKAPASPQEVQLILDAMGVKISNKLGLLMLLNRKWLPPDTDLEAELKTLEQLAQEQAKQMAASGEAMQQQQATQLRQGSNPAVLDRGMPGR